MIGWDQPAFFASPWIARMSDRGDGRLGLDPLHHDPAARRPAGAAAGGRRKPRRSTAPARGSRSGKITFPLMLPVSITAIILRIIFKLKLADIVINVTSGGPGRRHRHGLELHLPRISRPLERRLRHDAGDGLSGHHHRVHHAASQSGQQAHAEDDVMARDGQCCGRRRLRRRADAPRASARC